MVTSDSFDNNGSTRCTFTINFCCLIETRDYLQEVQNKKDTFWRCIEESLFCRMYYLINVTYLCTLPKRISSNQTIKKLCEKIQKILITNISYNLSISETCKFVFYVHRSFDSYPSTTYNRL